jgi:hypothetical protein
MVKIMLRQVDIYAQSSKTSDAAAASLFLQW